MHCASASAVRKFHCYSRVRTADGAGHCIDFAFPKSGPLERRLTVLRSYSWLYGVYKNLLLLRPLGLGITSVSSLITCLYLRLTTRSVCHVSQHIQHISISWVPPLPRAGVPSVPNGQERLALR
eukprot:COSAG01_NODE_4695_length_4807_cov_113.303314_1_plen_124_part_00